MKTTIKSILIFTFLLSSFLTKSQTTVYADTVLAFSNEYSSAYGASKILGSPDVYPSCGDFTNSWTFVSSSNREWIEIGYFTQLYVDTIRIYETNTTGAIDTVYIRDESTGLWNIVYSAPMNIINSCNVKDIVVPTTTYKVDAVRFTIGDNYNAFQCYPEYDAVALIGTPFTASIDENKLNDLNIFPNPSTGQIMVKTEGKEPLLFTVFDVLGNVVFRKDLVQKTEHILLNIPKGVYVSVIEQNGEKTTRKLIIQ